MAVVQTLIGNVKGPQGDTGATGQQGPQGDAATINVGTVSTTAYGNAAQVTNVGTESDAVLNFVIPQGKPGERTTTMGGLTLDTITTQTADYPVPAVGDTGATAFGKIVKWFSDALTAITGKLDKANVVNNLTTTAGGYALDARQGKTLNGAITGKLDKANVVNNLTTTAGGYALDARQGKALNDALTPQIINMAYNTSTLANIGGRTAAYRVGRVVVVNINSKTTGAVSAGSTLYTGLPSPARNLNSANTAAGSVALANGTAVRIYVDNSGKILTEDAISSQINFNGSISYIAAS